MTKWNTLNVKMSNSQLNKLKSRIENGTEVTLNLSLNRTGDSNFRFFCCSRNVSRKKTCKKMKGDGITLTNNGIKFIMKVIKSLKNREILLKGSTQKVTTQEGGFIIFFRPLMKNNLISAKKIN